MQNITSKDTSVNTLNRVYKLLAEEYPPGTVILDYGCGKYHTNEDYAKSRGFIWYGYDPYNKSYIDNIMALNCKPDIIVCSNVLNVLEDDAMFDVMRAISEMNVPVYYTIYEGSTTGVGCVTTKGYQRNEKAAEYVDWLKMLYPSVNKNRNIIRCSIQN